MATDLLSAERITHVLTLTENELTKRQLSGFYRDIEVQPSADTQSRFRKKDR